MRGITGMLVAQSCPTLCDPTDCSPPGSSVHGTLQARMLEWVAISSSRGSSPPRGPTLFSLSPALAGRFFTTSATWEVLGTGTKCCVTLGRSDDLPEPLGDTSPRGTESRCLRKLPPKICLASPQFAHFIVRESRTQRGPWLPDSQ